MKDTNTYEYIFDKITKQPLVQRGTLYISNGQNEVLCQKGYGALDFDTHFLAASITKLFTTACIFILEQQNKLSRRDPISKYFDEKLLSGLHIFKKTEYSTTLTIENLLYQNSGLPDFFEEGKHRYSKEIIKRDFSYSFAQNLEATKALKPHFIPASKKKAFYADINFDMLGEIIECVTQLPLSEVFRTYLFEPLEMTNTFLPDAETDDDAIPTIYYKERLIHRPQFIKCAKASGGAVSSANDLMKFLKGFFQGRLFPKVLLSNNNSYAPMQMSMGPVSYGCGMMVIPLHGVMTLFRKKGCLFGHSGTSGSFAFYYPEKDLYFTGTFDQFAKPALPIQFAMQLSMS